LVGTLVRFTEDHTGGVVCREGEIDRVVEHALRPNGITHGEERETGGPVVDFAQSRRFYPAL
jgi:hypothetical protein